MPLFFEGDLNLSVEGSQAHLSAQGVRLDLRLEDARQFFRSAGFSRKRIAQLIRSLADELHTRGLSLYVFSQQRVVMLIGKDANPGWLSRILGLPRSEIKDIRSFVRACVS